MRRLHRSARCRAPRRSTASTSVPGCFNPRLDRRGEENGRAGRPRSPRSGARPACRLSVEAARNAEHASRRAPAQTIDARLPAASRSRRSMSSRREDVWQYESLKQGRQDLEALRGEIQEVFKSHAAAVQIARQTGVRSRGARVVPGADGQPSPRGCRSSRRARSDRREACHPLMTAQRRRRTSRCSLAISSAR